MSKFKQVAAFILIFLGWMFIVSAVGWLMMKGWLFAAIFTPIGAALLYFGKWTIFVVAIFIPEYVHPSNKSESTQRLR